MIWKHITYCNIKYKLNAMLKLNRLY
jgi:hypothetical protein